MAIDYERLMSLETPDVESRYGDRETMLYALAVGMASDPLDRDELRFVYEKDLRAVPTMATVIAWDNRLVRESGVDYLKVVHGEQRVSLHRPLPPAAVVTARSRVAAAVDKGADKGALLYVETTIRDKASGDLLCTNLSTIFARGDGGFGGPSVGGPAPHRLPDRPPDAVRDLATRPDQALLYRLCGDRNPLHADPDTARAAGFPRPILHGLCTFGQTCRAVLAEMCAYDPARIKSFEARFSAPMFPGETIRAEMWRDGDTVSFRALVAERDALVLNNGKAELAPG